MKYGTQPFLLSCRFALGLCMVVFLWHWYVWWGSFTIKALCLVWQSSYPN